MVVVDLEFSRDDWVENGLWIEVVNEEDLKIARILNTRSKGKQVHL